MLAAALRIPGLRYGLPFPLLNPDEESIVPRAWEIGHGGGLDPGWYDYPSLLFYLLAPFEAFADEPSYGVARAVAAAIGIAGVGAAWWLGRVAYGAPAALVAGAATAVATVHVTYSHMAVTDVLADGRSHGRARAPGHGSARVGRRRDRPGGVREVPGCLPRACRCSSRLGSLAQTGGRGRPGGGRLRADEPVRAPERRRRLGRRLARPAPRARRLARLRGRPRDADRVPRPAVGELGPVSPGRGGRARARAPSLVLQQHKLFAGARISCSRPSRSSTSRSS